MPPTTRTETTDRKAGAAKAAKDLQRETRAMAAVVNNWLALSPTGRAYLMPQLVALEEAERNA